MIELTPETYFNNVHQVGPLHMVMHYGETCIPCKITLPQYELVYNQFIEFNVTNVKFYKFHQWDQSYKQFIDDNNLRPSGVPCFKYYYNSELIDEEVQAYNDANFLKKKLLDVCDAIHVTMGGFDLYSTQ